MLIQYNHLNKPFVIIPALNVSTAVAVSGDDFFKYLAFACACVSDDELKYALSYIIPEKY